LRGLSKRTFRDVSPAQFETQPTPGKSDAGLSRKPEAPQATSKRINVFNVPFIGAKIEVMQRNILEDPRAA
jgi:hypothetical protein